MREQRIAALKAELASRRSKGSNTAREPDRQGFEYIKHRGRELAGSLGEFAKSIPKLAGSAIKNPGEFAAGIPAGLASIGDIPALAGNIPQALAKEYANYEYGTQNTPEADYFPYAFHKGAEQLTNAVVGEPENEEQRYARGAGNIAGAFVNPGSLIKKGAQNLAGINPEKVNAFKEAGLQPSLGQVSNSKIVQGIEKHAGATPILGLPLQKSLEKNLNKISELQKGGLPHVEAGELAQSSLKGFRKRGNEVAAKLKAKVDSHIKPNERINISTTLDSIGNKRELYTPELQKEFASSDIGKRYKTIEKIANRADGNVPYNDLVQLRESIDNSISTFGLLGSKEQGALKNLRGSIQKDISNAFSAKSPEALKDFERYNKFYSAFAKKNEKIVNGMLKNKQATETFKDIVNNANVDARKAEAVINSLKPEQKEVFSRSLIRELGSNAENEFTGSKLATNFKKLEPESQKVVLSGLPNKDQTKFRANIDAIDAIKEAGEAKELGIAGKTALGAGLIYGGPAAFLPAVAANFASAALLANPKFVNWFSEATKLKNMEQVSKHLDQLPRIVAAYPELGPDVSQFLKGIEQKESPNQDRIKLLKEELERRRTKYTSQMDESGLEPELLKKIEHAESGSNPNARSKTSSANGVLQFTNGTWKEGVKKYGEEEGVHLRDKNKPEAQRKIARRMLSDNSKELEKHLGRKPKPGEIYATHFLGLGGTKKLLKSDKREIASHIFPKEANANRGIFYERGRPITVAELTHKLNSKIA